MLGGAVSTISEETKAAEEALRLIKEGQALEQDVALAMQRHQEQLLCYEAQKNTCYNSAYAYLLAAFGTSIFRDCDTLLESRDTTDIFDEVFLSARNGMSTFKGEHKILSLRRWLRVIARNLCLKELARRQRETQSESDLENVAAMPHDSAPRARQRSKWWEEIPECMLRQGIKQLTNTYDQMLLRMKMCQDMSIRDIADILGITENAVGVRLHRAAIRVQSLLGL